MKQRTMLLTMMLLGLALVLTSGISGLAQSKKKGKPSGGNNPTPIGIQVAEPVNRDEAKVKLVAATCARRAAKFLPTCNGSFLRRKAAAWKPWMSRSSAILATGRALVKSAALAR
ncbi:MAG: hypothetical protein U0X75_01615 [Acidobacteriota bacterium]